MVGTTHLPVLSDDSPESAGMSRERLDRAADYVARMVTDGVIPLAEILVARHGKIVMHRSFVHPRLSDQGTYIAPNSIFPLASFTKVLTATLVMRTVEMGRLSLETPVADYIPEFGRKGKGTITARHLLTHASGLADADTVTGRAPASFEELLEYVYEQPIVFEPGTRSSYCTAAYSVLVELLRRSTGRGLEELGQELLFGPLGMSNTRLLRTDELKSRMVPVFDEELGA